MFRFDSPDHVVKALEAHRYLPDDKLAAAVYNALLVGMPLLLEGDPGVGKTSLAKALAAAVGAPGGKPIRLQCYEGITAAQALYEWDFRAQLLALRAARTWSRPVDLYGDRFLIKRPILRAMTEPNSVLLIDEIDRADDEFEAYLLEALSEDSISIPELKKPPDMQRPIVVITSNGTRTLHNALKRRCNYHWIDHPDLERQTRILRLAFDEAGITPGQASRIAALLEECREVADLELRPGTAAAENVAIALLRGGGGELTEEFARSAIGLLAKTRGDQERLEAVLRSGKWREKVE